MPLSHYNYFQSNNSSYKALLAITASQYLQKLTHKNIILPVYCKERRNSFYDSGEQMWFHEFYILYMMYVIKMHQSMKLKFSYKSFLGATYYHYTFYFPYFLKMSLVVTQIMAFLFPLIGLNRYFSLFQKAHKYETRIRKAYTSNYSVLNSLVTFSSSTWSRRVKCASSRVQSEHSDDVRAAVMLL